MQTAAVSIGAVVTGIETVCTGQVLVPTLVVIIKDAEESAGEFLYLLVYSFMFILPLIVIFILTSRGPPRRTSLPARCCRATSSPQWG